MITGEYVALYQQQRYALKQRQVEKDDYISRLAGEREELQVMITHLQIQISW